jgi:4-hydroxy-3-methylbut-2-enyl diphosphate reductase|tara:strand:- start:49509 stop:50732 length:1224 start_codon:yes stop_codon:yes gene_type:complete
MKEFDIPDFYRSSIISAVKAKRKLADPRKKDFSPSLIDFGKVQFWIPRHFGFCYGVENAIEISYRAIAENPDKRIFLLSQMIHNPAVNEDLQSHGIKFIQDTAGRQIIPWNDLNSDDVVIIPAFGTTVEIEKKLTQIGVQTKAYNTTCPFVEKVWNRAEKLGHDKHTIVIHGKHRHEETRATFSHSTQNGHSIIVKDIKEAAKLADYILGRIDEEELLNVFKGKYSEGFDPKKDLRKIGVVNQTTMLANETQAITDFLRETMVAKYGDLNIKNHIADTRDTLCYATNDNQNSTKGLLDVIADFAIVVGGYNSSNTTHLVELMENKFPCYFIEDETKLISDTEWLSYDIHQHMEIKARVNLRNKNIMKIIISSGASCPDATVDRVIQRILELRKVRVNPEKALETMSF